MYDDTRFIGRDSNRDPRTCQLPDPKLNFLNDHLNVVVRLFGDVVVVLGVDADGDAGGVHDLGRGRGGRLLVDVEVVAKGEIALA